MLHQCLPSGHHLPGAGQKGVSTLPLPAWGQGSRNLNAEKLALLGPKKPVLSSIPAADFWGHCGQTAYLGQVACPLVAFHWLGFVNSLLDKLLFLCDRVMGRPNEKSESPEDFSRFRGLNELSRQS